MLCSDFRRKGVQLKVFTLLKKINSFAYHHFNVENMQLFENPNFDLTQSHTFLASSFLIVAKAKRMVDVRSVMEFWDDYCMYLTNGLQSLLKTFLYNLIPIHLQNLDFGLIDVGRSTEAKFIQEKKTFFPPSLYFRIYEFGKH